jgi:hypothetical protein
MTTPARVGDTIKVIVDGEILSATLKFFVWTGTLESVTENVSGVALADAVGVPVIAPETAFNDRPAGNAPEVSFQLYGVVPPVAASIAL